MKITDKRGSRSVVVARGEADVRRALTAQQEAEKALSAGRKGMARLSVQDAPAGKVLRRQGGSARGGVSMSLQRTRDPQHYWNANNDFYDTNDEKGLESLRELCRKLYESHSMIGSAIDVFSKWPITDAEFRSKDEKLEEFYTDLFFEDLGLEDLLVDIGREYWSVGEAFPMATWSETLGVWEHDELIDPDDVRVHKSPFLKDPSFEIRLPDDLRRVLTSRQPAEQYALLVQSYPELLDFAQTNAYMPISGHLIKHLRFKGNTFNNRGIPILSRGIRQVLQEEMLNSAQDSISDRLSTPFILARIGATAQELGTDDPWVPSQDQIDEFESLFDAALAADFRMMTTHFGVKVDSVFGRETMPRFNEDFDRLTERILQVFGLSKTMLSGAGSGQTYAADALNRDLVTQLLRVYQRILKRFVHERMLVVAEAQEHYDYEERNGRRYPIMEEVLEVDVESGVQRIVEQPKLLVPELYLRAMSMRDEEAEHAFLESARQAGVPISMKTRLANKGLDMDQEIEATREEQVNLAVENQKTRKATYLALKAEGLPIPDDLLADFEPKVEQPPGPTPEEIAAAAAMGQPLPGMEQMDPAMAGQQGAGDSNQRIPALGAEEQHNMALAPTAQGEAPMHTNDGSNVRRLPQNQALPPDIESRTRPPESDEQRAGMPRAGVRVTVPRGTNGADEPEDEEGMATKVYHGGMVSGPRHIGSRRYARVSAEKPLD